MPLSRPLHLALLTAAALLLLCGGCARGGRGEITDLFISNQRYVIDETRDMVHVYGRLENTGRARFRQVEVQVTLLSKSGSSRGENSTILSGIQPLEKRLFAVDVTSHGRVNSVDVQVREPKAP